MGKLWAQIGLSLSAVANKHKHANYISFHQLYFSILFSGMLGKHPDTLRVESFLLQFCPGFTPIRYNLTRLIFRVSQARVKQGDHAVIRQCTY